MADRFTRAFGSFLRRIVDMGDGTFSEQVVSKPPPNMVTGDRLKVELDEPIDVSLPAALINANRVKVEVDDPVDVVLPAALITGDRVRVTVDDPIDVVLPAAMIVANRLQVDVAQPVAVTLPAALVNANRLKVEVDDPIDVNLPNALITGGGIAGISPRIRVDPGQTGFFAGRMFRTYLEAVIPVAGPAVSFRFTSIKDFILWVQLLELTQGALRLEVFTGAITPSGTWTQLPIIGLNRMAERPTPFYVPTVTVETGGTFTGGTAVDLILIRSGSNQGSNSSQNTGGERSERGLPLGVYYGRFSTLAGGVSVTDAAQMVYSLTWEERG